VPAVPFLGQPRPIYPRHDSVKAAVPTVPKIREFWATRGCQLKILKAAGPARADVEFGIDGATVIPVLGVSKICELNIASLPFETAETMVSSPA